MGKRAATSHPYRQDTDVEGASGIFVRLLRKPQNLPIGDTLIACYNAVPANSGGLRAALTRMYGLKV